MQSIQKCQFFSCLFKAVQHSHMYNLYADFLLSKKSIPIKRIARTVKTPDRFVDSHAAGNT